MVSCVFKFGGLTESEPSVSSRIRSGLFFLSWLSKIHFLGKEIVYVVLPVSWIFLRSSFRLSLIVVMFVAPLAKLVLS